MFLNLFQKKKSDECSVLNKYLVKLSKKYGENEIDEDRKKTLSDKIKKYGYLPYSQIKALEELTDAEVLFALKEKFKQQKVFQNNKFSFKEISPLKRKKITNSNWIKNNQHNIKLVNLASLGNGNKEKEGISFFDWLRQIVILPCGNKNVISTTIYLIPFHPREFGCAYLPASSDVSPSLYDKQVGNLLELNKEEQVQLFIKFAQLAGHPVIYDILPQTSRFSKMVLSNPYIARWVDVKFLINQICVAIDEIKETLYDKFEQAAVDCVADLYKKDLNGEAFELQDNQKRIYEIFDERLKYRKIEISRKVSLKAEQIKLQKRVKEIIANTHELKKFTFKKEEDITKQGECIQNLIKEGLWPMPGGAWCSAHVPIFDKMADNGAYPIFKHYDYKGEDVSEFANLDCQTPFYFVNFEDGTYNEDVIDFFINNLVELQEKYNFDGYRVDHIDHVVDDYSQKDGVPISYRAPAFVLGKLSKTMKKKIPYFVMLAEYMLWDKFYKEYHEDMSFDLLWGNDIIMQNSKTPMQIIEDNRDLAEYNASLKDKNPLSIIKTYNNQDGEFEAIDQYPGQLGEQGALFKWFKYKFIPGGELAKRPVMYIDGDETFTKTGIERTIGAEVPMIREKNYKFFSKFNSIRKFALENELLNGGEAEMIDYDDDGFAAWIVSKDPLKQRLLVVANYLAPTEKFIEDNQPVIKEGHDIENKKIDLPCDYKLSAEIKFNKNNELKEYPITESISQLVFDKLAPSEFKIYKLN